MKHTWLALCLLVLAASARSEEPSPILLPDEGETVVIRLDHEGGFRAPRPNGAPRLAVLADGTLRANVEQKILTARLSRDELLALLRLTVEEHRFFAFDRVAALKTTHEATQREVPTVEDAADTVIRITLKDRSQQASFPALAWMAKQYPEVRTLQDLRAIERRLENLVQVVHAGGEERIAPLLAAANGRLQKEEPRLPPLAITDLVRAHHWPGGGMDLLFERAAGSGTLRVRVDTPPSGPVVVSIDRSPENR